MKRFAQFIVGLFALVAATSAFAAVIGYEELVSVGTTSAGFGWHTDVPAPSVVRLGETPLDLAEYSVPGERLDHYVEVTGLEPGRLYVYRVGADDDGRVEQPLWWSPGNVRTLSPPPGAYLFTFATVNDTHIGEDVAGLIAIGDFSFTPGFTWDDPDNPYWKFTNEAAVAAINDSDAAFVIHKGDVTADADDWQYQDALDIYGALDTDIFYARGNHDRIQHGEDYFKEMLGIADTDYWFDEGPLRFVIVDSNSATGSGDVTPEQIEWLRGVLDQAAAGGMRVMIFAHHSFAPGALFWGVNGDDAKALTSLLSEYDNVAAMFAGHSHRAALITDLRTGNLPYVETPATKEYPMGYTLYDVYEGGFTQTFHRTACEECLAWATITRDEYFGFAPYMQLGLESERNFTYVYPGADDDAGDDDAAPDDDMSDDDAAGNASDSIGDDDDDSACGC